MDRPLETSDLSSLKDLPVAKFQTAPYFHKCSVCSTSFFQILETNRRLDPCLLLPWKKGGAAVAPRLDNPRA